METWEYKNNAIAELQGFTLVGSTWKQRRQHTERSYGGIATFIKSQFLTLIHLEVQYTSDQYHWLSLGFIGGCHCYLKICNFAPLFMQSTQQILATGVNHFIDSLELFLKFHSKEDVFLDGDFMRST